MPKRRQSMSAVETPGAAASKKPNEVHITEESLGEALFGNYTKWRPCKLHLPTVREDFFVYEAATKEQGQQLFELIGTHCRGACLKIGLKGQYIYFSGALTELAANLGYPDFDLKQIKASVREHPGEIYKNAARYLHAFMKGGTEKEIFIGRDGREGYRFIPTAADFKDNNDVARQLAEYINDHIMPGDAAHLLDELFVFSDTAMKLIDSFLESHTPGDAASLPMHGIYVTPPQLPATPAPASPLSIPPGAADSTPLGHFVLPAGAAGDSLVARVGIFAKRPQPSLDGTNACAASAPTAPAPVRVGMT